MEENIDFSIRYYGQIKFYNTERGFGFIVEESKEMDVFYHFSALGPDTKIEELKKGTPVGFFLRKSKKGIMAKEIEVLRSPKAILQKKKDSDGKSL